MTETPPRRRRFPRLASRHAVLVERLDGDDDAAIVATRGVGLGGLAFRSERPFGDGTRLRLRINVGREVVEADGRVAWERSADDDGWEIGVEFERLGEGDRGRLALLLADAASD